MQIQQSQDNFSPILFQTITYPLHLPFPSTLMTLLVSHDSLFCGYSDGRILEHRRIDEYYELSNNFRPYQNIQIIDIKWFNECTLALCTHTEVSLYDMVKNKRISLKGHESTPLSLSCHPVSPLIASVSNLLIEHDARTRKPINVNFITPPVYAVEYLPSGQYYLLSGEPCRIGQRQWCRTLLNGIATASFNSKFILCNDLNGKINLWDWHTSQLRLQLTQINNHNTYQKIHFGIKDYMLRDILFLEDNGVVLQHDISNGITKRCPIIQDKGNWKIQLNNRKGNTQEIIVYQHERAEIKIFKI